MSGFQSGVVDKETCGHIRSLTSMRPLPLQWLNNLREASGVWGSGTRTGTSPHYLGSHHWTSVKPSETQGKCWASRVPTPASTRLSLLMCGEMVLIVTGSGKASEWEGPLKSPWPAGMDEGSLNKFPEGVLLSWDIPQNTPDLLRGRIAPSAKGSPPQCLFSWVTPASAQAKGLPGEQRGHLECGQGYAALSPSSPVTSECLLDTVPGLCSAFWRRADCGQLIPRAPGPAARPTSQSGWLRELLRGKREDLSPRRMSVFQAHCHGVNTWCRHSEKRLAEA